MKTVYQAWRTGGVMEVPAFLESSVHGRLAPNPIAVLGDVERQPELSLEHTGPWAILFHPALESGTELRV